MWLQKADVEDRMDMHGRRKIESERRCASLTNDSKGAKSTNIQLGRRTSCGEVWVLDDGDDWLRPPLPFEL